MPAPSNASGRGKSRAYGRRLTLGSATPNVARFMANPSDSRAAPARPSVFISYASQDRAAARSLRDILLAAGLVVWYDENELGGGDAWDQKIRRQIRECDYFMALISAGTESRKEGYFRREWRLAAERTLDMADDVLFLLPIAIDDTREAGARVPDKFTSVQWLRAPGGMRTPALDALIGRLVHGEHHIDRLTRSPMPASERLAPPLLPRMPIGGDEVPRESDRRDAGSANAGGRTFPDFPKVPHGGSFSRWVEFSIDSLRWVFVTGARKFKQLPRLLRLAIIAVFLISLLPHCERADRASSTSAVTKGDKTKVADEALRRVDAALKLAGTAQQLDQSAASSKSSNLESGFAKAGADIARAFSKEVGAAEKKSGSLTVVPFSAGLTDDATSEFARQVFSAFYRQLVEAKGDTIGISLEPADSKEVALARGQKLKTEYVVAAPLLIKNGKAVLSLHMYNIEDETELFAREIEVSGDPVQAGKQAADGVLSTWRNQ